MTKLSLTDREWREFFISDIFEIKDGYYNKKPPMNENGNIPFLGATQYNNGNTGFTTVEIINSYNKAGELNNKDAHKRIFNGNCLAVTNNGSVGHVYYQESYFTCSHDITVLYTKSAKLNPLLAKFLIVSLQQTGKSFEYAKKWRPKRMRKSKIILPINSNNKPDWQFMEKYIKQLEQDKITALLNYYRDDTIRDDTRRDETRRDETRRDEILWAEFKLSQVFFIKSGVRLTKQDMISGDIPFIGATEFNNGITAFVGNINASLDSQVLGVNYNGSVAESFYHPYESVFSDDVKRFELKSYGNKWIYLFMKTMILNQKDKYQYGYKFNVSRMENQKIMLPIDKDGNLNWQFMENTMKKIVLENTLKILRYYEL